MHTCNYCQLLFLFIALPIDTHLQLEAQLSDAFKEDDNIDGFVSIKKTSSDHLSDSDSDSEEDDHRLYKNLSPETPDNPFLPFEASILSMDTSTMMSSSVIDTEVHTTCTGRKRGYTEGIGGEATCII